MNVNDAIKGIREQLQLIYEKLMDIRAGGGGGGGGAPTDAQYVVLALNASLSAERVLTGTANQITVTDNGPNSTVVLSLPQSIATTSGPTFDHLHITNGIDIGGGQSYSIGGNPVVDQALLAGSGPTFDHIHITNTVNADDILLTAAGYINWGAAAGSTGYGFRDNSGAIEVKHSGGTGWAKIPHITISDSGPSGGTDGDLWFEY